RSSPRGAPPPRPRRGRSRGRPLLAMPTICQHRRVRGAVSCAECPALTRGLFERVRLGAGESLPPADPRIIDVAVLDMNHGWPNVGHEGVLEAVQDAACANADALADAGLKVRAISFDVRRALRLPD